MKKSIITVTALVCMLLLVLVAGVLPLVGGSRVLGLSQPGGAIRGDRIQANWPEGMSPPEGFTPGDGSQPPAGGNGQMPGRGNFNPGSGLRGQGSIDSMKLMQLLQYGIGGAVLLLGMLSIIGLWLNRTWGKVLAIITAAIVLASTIPSLFRFIVGGWTLAETASKIVLAIAIAVFIFIPVKKTVEVPV